LSQMDGSRHITLLDREEYGKFAKNKSGNAQPASFAAAGMLAPQSERLESGHLLDLCMASRRMYPDFCDMVETLARESGDEGAPYLHENEFSHSDNENMDPWSVGYVGTGGFLAPAFAGDAVATWAPPEEVGSVIWLDAMQVRELEPLLHPDVVGGWWFSEDASVDARRLTCSLRAACVAAGVQFLSGPQYEVASLDLVDGQCRGMWLKNSKTKQWQRYIRAKTVLIANGAWMRNLLPVPIEPHKGQSLSLRMPKDQPPILRRVLFAQDSYIVPKADGRIVIGATVEAGSYDPNVTPAGLMHIMTHAIQLVPALKDLPVEETWAGLRPTTPDKGPILGKTPWDNMFVAGGYWRNGVLLAPKTGQLLASLIVASSNENKENVTLSTQDAAFLDAFGWDRFTTSGKGAAMAANARYAASMYPIHKRSTQGVSAAVGTELGSYSSARAAAADRKRDRDALQEEEDEAFERAAAMGKQDGSAYTISDGGSTRTERVDSSNAVDVSSADTTDWPSLLRKHPGSNGKKLPASPAGKNGSSSSDLAAAYETIRKNKARNSVPLDSNDKTEERPDPGFRIFHIDAETGEKREVPPYTQPGDFLQMIASQKKSMADSTANGDLASSSSPLQETTESEAIPTSKVPSAEEDNDDYSEKTYDGYQAIVQSNSRTSRDEELETMREARRKNRLGQEEIDFSQIGVVQQHLNEQPLNGETAG